MRINLRAAWIGFFMGCVAGAIPGLFFHGEEWLGGYASWPRRMIRLGHISFFGLGFLNLAFALTVETLAPTRGVRGPSTLLIVGALAMPAVCYLSAWNPAFRALFCIPATSVTVGVAWFAWTVVLR